VNRINEELRAKLEQALEEKGKLEKKVDWLEHKVNRLEVRARRYGSMS
jgi:predicted nuclease with TOPRIM domain